MKLRSHLLQRVLHLPPPLTRDVVVEQDLEVPMRDGTVLLADRWMPKSGGDGLPTAVFRCPYGRRGQIASLNCRPLAERGFQVLFQSARGTFGSGGAFEPFRHEREDGLDTLDWVIEQPWFGDSIVLIGGSYLGYVQWAVADQAPPEVKAMIPTVSNSALTLDFYRKDGFSLEIPFTWGVLVDRQERRFAMLRQMLSDRQTQRAMHTLPLRDADLVRLGHHTDYLQDILRHDTDDPYWAAVDHRHRVADIRVPTSVIGGWFDLFLPGMLEDFKVLQGTGTPARLTVGPWGHVILRSGELSEAVEFGLAHARGEEPPARAAVQLFVMGEKAWRDFPSWPPPGYRAQRFHLQPGGALATDRPAASAPDGYRYDPADPTPAAGGVRMSSSNRPGRVNNAKLEARPDVLTYTTDVLEYDVEVIGEVRAEIWFRSSLPFADVFVRLCDVDEKGRSTNVCDGLTSLADAEQTACAAVELWPTAYRFKRGHRIRVQVSSGAFPRFNRNPGTGEPRADATVLRAAQQLVFHDPEHPSAVVLPVRDIGAASGGSTTFV